ncbi:MAG: methionyl-tRNA formyltransferase, partial [Myxococcota bacterium]
MKKKLKIIFMGRKPAASVALRRLVDRGVEVVAVVAPLHPEQPVDSTFWRPLLRNTAKELGIPVVT